MDCLNHRPKHACMWHACVHSSGHGHSSSTVVELENKNLPPKIGVNIPRNGWKHQIYAHFATPKIQNPIFPSHTLCFFGKYIDQTIFYFHLELLFFWKKHPTSNPQELEWPALQLLDLSKRLPRKGELVGGWTNPIEYYARQIVSFPQGWT